MKPFLPSFDDPWSVIYAAALFIAVGASWYLRGRLGVLSLIMLANWIGTRLSVSLWSDELAFAIAATDVISIVAILLLVRSVTGHAIVTLFALMLACYAAYDFGWLNFAQMGAMVDVFAFLQLALMVGGDLNGHRRIDHSRGTSDIRGAVVDRGQTASSRRPDLGERPQDHNGTA